MTSDWLIYVNWYKFTYMVEKYSFTFGGPRWFKNESGLKSDYVTKKCTRPITELNKPLIFPFNSRGFQTFRMYYVRMYFIQYQASLKPLWLYDIFILFVALLGELVWSGLI